MRSFSALHFLVDILPLDLRGKWNIKYTSLDTERGFFSRNNFMPAGSANFFCVKYRDFYG